ncbi:MAG: DUF134 domain-containing protein [Thermoplasmata archaeon]
MNPAPRGRRRGRRWIDWVPPADMYYPRSAAGGPTGLARLSVEEMEALRLVDLLGLPHEEAAGMMGVSRKTLWRDLTSARRKLVEALINGWAIQISGGDYLMRGGGESER